MKARIKVTYHVTDCPTMPYPQADEIIRKKIESIGGKWCAQDGNLETGIRDIVFDLEVKIPKE